jgi:hypothetical protein
MSNSTINMKLCNVCGNEEMYSEYNHKSEELKEFCDICGHYHTVELINKSEDGQYDENWTPQYEEIEECTGYVLKIFPRDEVGHHTAPINKEEVKTIIGELKNDDDVVKFAISFKDVKGCYQTQIYDKTTKIENPKIEKAATPLPPPEPFCDIKIDFLNNEIKTSKIDTNHISDGYHTFGELYEHRIVLFIALCREIANNPAYQDGQKSKVWKSMAHSDGSAWKGWFIMGLGQEQGEQITYHLPIKYWDETNFANTIAQAPSFDGHSSNDVLSRISKL